MNSPLGWLTLIATERALTEIRFGKSAKKTPENSILKETREQLEEYFAGNRKDFSLPLEPDGTPFQKKVWKALAKINFGKAKSYGAIAKSIKRPNSYRAVGNAVGRNPLSIIVPCHRVVATNGLGGFTGGLTKKKALLRLEGYPVAMN